MKLVKKSGSLLFYQVKADVMIDFDNFTTHFI